MTTPILVCLISALVGNVLGYTVLKNVCAGMYYGSYSLPTYVTIWNGEAFLLTTVVPCCMALGNSRPNMRRRLANRMPTNKIT